jgi:hypothetical protein
VLCLHPVFQGHTQSALSVPRLVTFPFVFAALFAWQKIKSNKNASFTQSQKNRSVEIITLRFCHALFTNKNRALNGADQAFQ